MRKKNDANTMKAWRITFSLLDASSIFSIWGKGALERSNVRMAVEVNDIFELFLGEHSSALMKAAEERGKDGEEAAMDVLTDTTGTFTMSCGAFDSLHQAIKDHNGWTMRGARQLLRIEDAFAAAELIDLEPKKVELEDEGKPEVKEA